jgi:hypothetical protein
MSGYILHLDESIRWRLISVGGFIVASDDLSGIRQEWAVLRAKLGLREDELLKWNFGEQDATRRRLEAAGWTKAKRADAVVETISQLPVTLVADILADERRGERGPLDFYRYGVDYVCVGFRNHACWDMQSAGPHFVVVDAPAVPPKHRPNTDDSTFDWLKNRDNIWHIHYRKKFAEDLGQHGFYPSLLVSHAKYNQFLEIADAIAGLALDFAEYNLKGFRCTGELPEVGWQDRGMARLVGRFRRGPGGTIRKFGFTLFPEWIPGGKETAEWLDRLDKRSI